MSHRVRLCGAAIGLIFCASVLMRAGGALETIDITNAGPSPIPEHTSARVVGIKWDTRSVPVSFTLNTSVDPIPNPLGPAFLSLAETRTALEQSFDAWNAIPTSFIEMHITGTTSKTKGNRFDFVNELRFLTSSFGGIAGSRSVSLIRDETLVDGMDIDGDGDSDVSGAITVVTDVDGDGDLEFPAGLYKAGTILDSDVLFNTSTSNGFRFTVDPAAADTVIQSVDLMAVAVHEFGHSQGLSHSPINQHSAADGSGATMYPFIDTADPADELAQRTLDSDDIAWSSYFYPEGSAASGPAAIQPGDVAFGDAYGIITGEVRHGLLNEPVAGAHVIAMDWKTRAVVAGAFSGTTQRSRSPDGRLFTVDAAFNILDGRYTIPVPTGSYVVAVEPIDGQPIAAADINQTTLIGRQLGQQNFNEELYARNQEGVLERRPGRGTNVSVKAGETVTGIDVTTNRTFNLRNFGNRNSNGFTLQPAGSYYAVRIPASQVQAVFDKVNERNPGHDVLVQSAGFNTTVVDASVAPLFVQAVLTTGSTNADGSLAAIDLATPLAVADGFVGQQNDFTPLYFDEPHVLGKQIRDGIRSGTITNLFLVLRLPTATPFPGVSGSPPLIGLDGRGGLTGLPNDVPIFGLSYVSTDGGTTFNHVVNFNFMFELVLAEPANP